MNPPPLKHYAILDFIRGFAAFWVFVSHAFMPSGVPLFPIIGDGRAAVDIFMALSGFLIFDRYCRNRGAQEWGRYFVARIFRICPVFYILLTAAAFLMVTDSAESSPWLWLFYRFTFVFGILPQYFGPAPLPDWSIALEMQFYLAFPVLIILGTRIGWKWVIALCSLLTIVFFCLFTVYTINPPGPLGNYGQPTLLFSKLPMFWLGSLIAIGRDLPVRQIVVLHALNFAGVLMPALTLAGFKSSICIYFLVLAVCYLPSALGFRNHPAYKAVMSFATGKVFIFLGAISYALYLFHPIVYHWMEILLMQKMGLSSMGAFPRFFIFLAVSTAVVIPCSYLIHIVIEKPGIALGKQVSRKLFPKKSGASRDQPEQVVTGG